MMKEAKAAIINRLQKDILRWQGFSPVSATQDQGIGLGPIEHAFPNGVFPIGTIHEMLCPTAEDSSATCGFLSGLLASLSSKGGVCLWISTGRKLFPPSLNAFHAEADRLIFIDLKREKDVLWATEEALKCEGIAAVITEIEAITFAQSRRLQLAVESSKVTGFILRNNLKKLSSTVCVARWHITPLPGFTEDKLPGVGFPRWQVELLRVRNGNPGVWELEWNDKGFKVIEEAAVQPEVTHHLNVG